MITLNNYEARKFILLKQGLLGRYKFTGKAGILAFMDQVGCIQFDPIDIFGLVSQFVLGSNKNSGDAAGEEGAQPAEGATSQ